MKKRIFRTISGVALASILLVSLLVIGMLYATLDAATWRTFRSQAQYVAAGYEAGGMPYLDRVTPQPERITLVAADGTVLYDTVADPADMENHAERPEVQAALQSGAGETQRRSDTLGQKTIYYALRLQDGSVLRLSSTVDSLFSTVLDFVPLLLLICAVAVALAAVMAHYATRAILAPLSGLNLEQPLQNRAYGELSPLLRRIEKQNEQIEQQMATLREQQREFDAITHNLREGLVVLSCEGMVLSANRAALHIFGAQENAAHGHILELYRSLPLEKAVQRAAGGEAKTLELSLHGRRYRCMAEPVAAPGGGVEGVVLLLLDETEKLQADEMRREFTANVSHELKTPLTSIRGYAELIKDGMAKPQDTPGFAVRIYNEANRLIALVEDILQLSRLDERQAGAPYERVDLRALAQEVAERLARPAGEKGIALEVEGPTATVQGVRQVLEEVMMNLCDNAIKYGKTGGHVWLTLEKAGNGAAFTVRDDGIGIPEEEQSRVFERFYRVDKSHSKDTGGTGLGLSIVKHGVALHSGNIDLRSEEGVGTSVRVALPGAPGEG